MFSASYGSVPVSRVRSRAVRLISVLVGIPVSAIVASYTGSRFLPQLEYKSGESNGAIETKSYIFANKLESISNKLQVWRTLVIGRYENRIRAFSHPSKVFNYFASATKADGEVCMTPEDFIRSFVRFNNVNEMEQPDLLYQRLKAQSAYDFFRYADTDGDGLISFNEYITFLTLILVSESNLDAAFKAIDTDNNNTLSRAEFLNFMQNQVADMGDVPLFKQMGNAALRQNSASLSNQKFHGLLELFFGHKSQKENENMLSKNEFIGFMKRLRFELRKLEFYQFPVDEEDNISMRDFCFSLIGFLPENEKVTYQNRLNSLPHDYLKKLISFTDFECVDRIAMAVDKVANHYNLQKSVDIKQLDSLVKKILGTKMEIQVKHTIENLFANEKDGQIELDKLIKVFRTRRSRGLDTPRDTGFSNWLTSLGNNSLKKKD